MGTKNMREVKSRRIIAELYWPLKALISKILPKNPKKQSESKKIINKGKLQITTNERLFYCFFIN